MSQNNRDALATDGSFSAQGILLAIALLIFIGARLWRLTSTCLWFDEVFSVHAARHSWPEMFRFVAADIIHPPLFYALLKAWIALGGESMIWLRLLPLILAILTLAPLHFLCREMNLKVGERNLVLLLIAVSGFLIKYAQEVRMYSLLLLLSTTSIWLFVRFLRTENSRRAPQILLAVCNLLLVYTHYYGWLLIVSQLFVLLMWQRKMIGSFILALAGLLAAYLPWIYAVAKFREPARGLAQNIGWIERPRLHHVAEYFVLLNKPFLFSQSTLDRADSFLIGWLALFLIGSAFAILVIRRWRARAFSDAERVLLVLVFVPLVLAFGLSWILPYSIWGTRHLIISVVPFFILSGIALANLRPNWMRIGVLMALALVIAFSAAVYLLKPAPKLSWCAWDGLVTQIPANPDQSKAVIYTFEDLVAYHVWFGTTQTKEQSEVKIVKGLSGLTEDPAFFLPRRFSEIETVPESAIAGDVIWVAFRARRWDESRPPLSNLKMLGYEPRNTLSAPALGEQAFLVELARLR